MAYNYNPKWAKEYYKRPEIRERQRRWFAELRKRRRAAGLCQTCGSPKVPNVSCVKCSEYWKWWRWGPGRQLMKQKWRRRDLKRYFNMTLQEFEHLNIKQHGLCEICKRPPDVTHHKNLAADHDHKTGKLRGLLCGMCNGGLGLFQDDIGRLKAAIRYLRKHSS